MPCFSPLRAWRSKDVNPDTGKRSIIWKHTEALCSGAFELLIPCGKCIGCRLKRASEWAIRCVHEAQLHDVNTFITLTYDDKSLPPNGSLVKKDWQMFMRRLRKRVDVPIRFYMAGEYGEKQKRPHYHACLFGFDFEDKYFFKKSRSGEDLFRSPMLEELWPYGHSTIGAVTYESAAYVARYITKKIGGSREIEHYGGEILDPDTGELTLKRLPEFNLMSRKPGIAADWIDEYSSDIYPSDEVVLSGKRVRKYRPPKYYDGRFGLTNPKDLFFIKINRVKNAQVFADRYGKDLIWERMRVRELCSELKNKKSYRSYEKDEVV